MDGAGRVVLPKPLRERFRLNGGDKLTIEVRDDAIELRPARRPGQLSRINGVLVYEAGAPLDADRDLAAESRAERIKEITQDLRNRR